VTDLPITKINAAPSAAPDEVPTRPGSTMGLRNKACIMAPATDKAAPTNAHNITLGSRIWKNTASSIGVKDVFGSRPIRCPRKARIFANEISTAPIPVDITKDSMSSMVNAT
ncbi:MAG TPA: hypothetical protein VLD19_05390, partial [Chitinophagaceae bacterium]|nr:hypothetical protein [Chitinophagaceae bacterium]